MCEKYLGLSSDAFPSFVPFLFKTKLIDSIKQNITIEMI